MVRDSGRDGGAGSKGLRLPDHLPPLSGWVLLVYRILWCAAAVLALASVALGYRTEVADQRAARAFYDLGLFNVGPSGAGRIVQPFSPQAKSLFSGSEVLLAVNGRPVPVIDREGQILALAGLDGASATVALRRADGSLHQLLLTHSSSYLTDAYAGTGISWGARRWTVFGAVELVNLLWLTTALLLFLRRSSDPVAALIALGAVWGAIDPAALLPSLPALIVSVSQQIVNILFFTSFLTFPDGHFRPRWARTAAIVGVAASLALVWVEQSAGASGVLRLVLSLIWLGLIVAVTAATVTRYRTTAPGVAKQQIKLAIFGFVTGFLCFLIGSCCFLAQNSVDSEAARAWLMLIAALAPQLGNVFIAAGLLVSLLRYRLYDADATISRSVAYGTLTLALLAIFAGTEKIIEVLGEEYFGESLGALAGGIGAALAAVMIVPLHHRVSHWAEKRFRKQLIKLRHGLPLLVGDLRETAGLERIAAAALDEVTAGVRASRAALLVGETVESARGIDVAEVEAWRLGWTPATHAGLDCDRSDPLFPMRVPLEAEGCGHVGWLLLGPRPDGSFYGKDERAALAEIADPVARAVEIVKVRRMRETQIDGVLASIMERLTSVEQAIAGIHQPPSAVA